MVSLLSFRCCAVGPPTGVPQRGIRVPLLEGTEKRHSVVMRSARGKKMPSYRPTATCCSTLVEALLLSVQIDPRHERSNLTFNILVKTEAERARSHITSPSVGSTGGPSVRNKPSSTSPTFWRQTARNYCSLDILRH